MSLVGTPPLMLDARDFVRRNQGLALDEFERRYPHAFLLIEHAQANVMDDTGFRTIQAADEGGGTPGAPPPPPPTPEVRDRLVPVAKGAGTPFPSMITVGRASNNDIVLKFSQVSKFHAYFTFDPRTKRYGLTDAGSTNGTSLNRKPLGDGERLDLNDGDEIDFGGGLGFAFFTPAGLHRYLPALQRRMEAPRS